MRISVYSIVLLFFVSSCAVPVLKKVRVEDTDAWKGIDLYELESHPVFSLSLIHI